MGIALGIAIFFGLIGIFGLIYTVHYGRRSIKKKLLVYEISRPIALAQAFSPEDDYKMSVLFQRKGSPEEKIESVFTTFLKFANLGKEPIRGNDIAKANPVKINIEGTRTLDIQIAGTTRKVNNVILKKQIVKDKRASGNVYFDFLDYQDGALIKILSVGNRGKISLAGDIIGMPEGIKNVEEFEPTESKDITDNPWFVISILIAGLILSGFIYYWVTGTWRNAWLLLVPIGVMVLQIIIMFAIDSWSWPRARLSFPKSLDLPKWCRSFGYYPSIMMRAELLAMAMEEKTDEVKKGGKLKKKGESN